MNNGYVIAQNKRAEKYFTSSSSYDRPQWIPITEATTYPTADIAQAAATKLWKNGSYSACVRNLSEALPPLESDNEQYQDDNQMVAGTLDDSTDDEVNLDDDGIETLDDPEETDDFDLENEPQFDEEDDLIKPNQEENEQAFLSPLEKTLSVGKRPTQSNIRLGEGVRSSYRTTQSDVPLRNKPAKERIPGMAATGGRTVKISDAEVKEMRTLHKKGTSKADIYKKWPTIKPGSINQILNYNTRLTPACEPTNEATIPKKHKTQVDASPSDNKTIATDLAKPDVIKYKQQISDPTDVNFANDIDSLHNPHSTPANIVKSLKDAIGEFNDAADYNNGKDDAQASMALTISSALQDILTDLQQGTEEGFKQAQIRITTYWNGITSNFPPEVIDYLYKRGRQPMSLKNIFYDKFDSIKKEY